MHFLKLFFTFLFSLFPWKFAHVFLKLLGHKITWKAKIGFSFLWIDKINLSENTVIGHFNFIKIDCLEINKDSGIGHFNFIKGPFKILLSKSTYIGKTNRFQRSKYPIVYNTAELKLGEGTRITTGNYFDLTNNITFGKNCQVAGMGSQFWTHGYIHANEGTDRIRIDGDIQIGNNVYIGSRCLFNPGVTVADAINIGGNSVISKNLTESGMYVNQPLRHIKLDIDIARNKFDKINVDGLVEEVYTKNNNL